MKRTSKPWISPLANALLMTYQTALEDSDRFQEATIRNYISDLRHFIAWCEMQWQDGIEPLVEFTLPNLSTPLIAQYRAYLLTTLHLKPASANRLLVSIKRFCQWALDHQMLTSDPARAIALVPLIAPTPRVLTDAEEATLLRHVATAAPVRDRAIILTLLNTGLRVQELCALPFAQVDLASPTGRLIVVGTGAQAREIPLDPLTQAAIILYVPMRPTAAIPLFVSPQGAQPLTARTVGRIVHTYAEQAHLGALSPQDLRHRYGYRLAQTHALPEVARLLGHASLASTVRYFAPPRGTEKEG